MTVLLYDGRDFGRDAWVEAVLHHFADCEVRVAPQTGDPADIDYVLVAGPQFTPLGTYPNLRGVLSQWAGVNHILADATLKPGIPIVRMTDLSLKTGMTEYVTYHVLRHHLRAPDYERQQRERVWKPLDAPMAPNRTVGILGLGTLGRDLAERLVHLRFQVRGWSRTRKEMEGVTCFAGTGELQDFLRVSEILVCLLPLTPETEDILDADLFAALPRGAYLVHAGRGPHLVEADLLQALADGQLSGATLDVFREEPLPVGHPFWTHPNITLTPHMASLTRPETGIAYLREAFEALERGERPASLVDREAGY
ncbi:2-hydroxyacid dehydrogenase [Futiania mangrovi]|uniref:Glyoxylate/hydroxypyruvate reductase A n=1 Tax=Futiania mangrovi TaxID=2959716 RepID=A0A9J6PCQ2_9PROT|nr:glyoxylate/hydroxypyruvate reductase A [Futiania mangrovii]MCP1335427.1 glyoxylate/hydroxypyruvate reductase A [Futiania mangrovii]